MRILLSTIGSRGDVQPLVALALQLKSLGQEVRVCVPPDFQPWIAGLGLPVTTIGPELRRMTGARPRAASAPMSPAQRQQLADASVAAQFETIATAATGCDVIVAATALQIAARSVAEKQGIGYPVRRLLPNRVAVAAPCTAADAAATRRGAALVTRKRRTLGARHRAIQ
jgi:vancomycin aglycone glucosyltransferase